MSEPNLDEQLHKILCHYIGNYVTADEYESDVKEAEQAIKALIADQVEEAYKKGYIDGGINVITEGKS